MPENMPPGLPTDEYRVVVGSNLSNQNPGSPFLNWLKRVLRLIASNWRYQALAAAIILVGTASVVFALVALRPSDSPPTTPSVQTEESTQPGTNGTNNQGTATTPPEDKKPSPDKKANNNQNTTGGSGNQTPGGSGGNTGGTGGTSTGGGTSGGGTGGNGNTGGSCALPKYPTPSCTGVPAGTNLVADGRCTLSTPGEVITGKQFNCRVDVTANGVTIKNSYLVEGINNWTGGGSFTIEDSTVGSASGCDSASSFGIGARKYTARRVHVRGIPDGFRISNLSGSESVTIEDSYYSSCSNPGDHSDGIQADGNSGNAIIRHNTLDISTASSSTSPIFWADAADGSHGTIENNLLIGGGYAIWLATGNGHIVTGNRLTAWDYGPNNSDCSTVSSWQDNRSVTLDGSYNATATGGLISCP